MNVDVVVVGAGVAGLSLARRLSEAGKRVLILEKSRGVGGRCATRRIGDISVDHGITFYHGDDEVLHAYLETAGRDGLINGWPARIRGSGTPCQPSAFRPGDWRLALTGGVNIFPKQLAADLDIRLNTKIISVEKGRDAWVLADENRQEHTAYDLVLTVPVPQALDLLDPVDGDSREFRSLRSLLRETGYISTLTVIAIYQEGTPPPDWEMWYPERSDILHLISHDSSKREQPARTALVLQAQPSWSRKNLETPPEQWSAAMLQEAAGLAGAWAAEPETCQTHRWRYARIGSGGDLTGPMMLTLPGGRRLGLAGDSFSPGGGVQAAWWSGRRLARRLLEDGTT